MQISGLTITKLEYKQFINLKERVKNQEQTQTSHTHAWRSVSWKKEKKDNHDDGKLKDRAVI